MNKKTFLVGLTLLEVIIAMSVLVVGILGVGASLNSALLARAQTREMTYAMNAARAKMEELFNENDRASSNGLTAVFNKYRFGQADNTFAVFVEENARTTAIKVFNPLNQPTTGMRAYNGPALVIPPTNDAEREAIIRARVYGWIDFPVGALADATIDETITDANADAEIGLIARDMGMTAADVTDLDGDGAETTGINPDDLLRLPVRVIVRWQSTHGVRQVKLTSVLSKRN